MSRVLYVFVKLIQALLCDKDKEGNLSSTPSFAKIAFWGILARFVHNPDSFTMTWFYLESALLAYILFGAKFIPTIFTKEDIVNGPASEEA